MASFEADKSDLEKVSGTDDLEADWDAVRGVKIPDPRPITVVDYDLEEDWATLRNLPKYIYMVRENFPAEFRIWRMKVHGERRSQTEDHWVVSHDRIIFAYGTPFMGVLDGKRYTIRKTQASLDLRDAPAWILNFQQNLRTHTQNLIREHQQEIRRCEQEIQGHHQEITLLQNQLRARLQDLQTQKYASNMGFDSIPVVPDPEATPQEEPESLEACEAWERV